MVISLPSYRQVKIGVLGQWSTTREGGATIWRLDGRNAKATNHHKKPTGARDTPVKVPTLDEIGIEKHVAKTARAAAAIPEEAFEEVIATHREESRPITTVSIVRAGTVDYALAWCILVARQLARDEHVKQGEDLHTGMVVCEANLCPHFKARADSAQVVMIQE